MSATSWSGATRDRFVRVTGELALSTAVAAVSWAAMLAWRISSHVPSHGLLYFWIPLTAVAVPPSLALVFLLRSANHGARVLWSAPDSSARRTTFLSLTTVSTSLGWAVLGFVLSAYTHHRGLGATTFAFLAGGWLALSMLVSWRLMRWMHRSAMAVLWSRLSAVVASVIVVWGLSRLAFGVSSHTWTISESYAYVVFDSLCLAAIALVASRIRLRTSNLRLVVPSILAVVVAQIAIGIGSLSHLVQTHGDTDTYAKIVTPLVHRLSHPDTRPKHIHKAVIR